MTVPSAITVRNYRAFKGEHRFELRPLTMLYGDNNVGKSALVRLLQVLDDSMAADTTGALRLESEAAYESGFHDVLWKGAVDEDEDPDLGIGFSWQEPSTIRSIDYTLVRNDTWRRILISRCRIREEHGKELSLEWVPLHDEAEAAALSYDYQQAEMKGRGTFEFRGLVPQQFPEPVAGVMAAVQQQLASFHGQVQWLQAKRQAPLRKLIKPSGRMMRMSSDGRDAAQVLYSNLGNLRGEISRWYEETIGRELHVVEAPPDEIRVAMRNKRRTQAFEVDMLDSGEGTIQVFPVLVALALMLDDTSRSPRILAVEEPESHLHGDLQLRLADLICQTIARADKKPRIVIETHSQEMLLGVQLALLQGVLAPDDVVIYWIRQDDDGVSHADRVTLDENAYLEGPWPDPFVHAREAARRVILERERRDRP